MKGGASFLRFITNILNLEPFKVATLSHVTDQGVRKRETSLSPDLFQFA